MSEVEENFKTCPYCNIEIWSSQLQETLLVSCLNPNCIDLVEFNEHCCESCGVQFSEEDWDLFLATAAPYVIDKIKEYYAADDPVMLCCTNTMMDCYCQNPISWDDTAEISQNIWETAYGDSVDNDCFTCSYQYTEHCQPLCNFVVNFFNNQNKLWEITVCQDYYADELVVDYTNNSEASEYIFINYEEF